MMSMELPRSHFVEIYEQSLSNSLQLGKGLCDENSSDHNSEPIVSFLPNNAETIESEEFYLGILTYFHLVIKHRSLRAKFFEGELFADPAWNILLDLTIARIEKKNLAVKSLCIAASVPTTTALRWIRTLVEAGLLERSTDLNDGRRSYIRLSDSTFDKMLAYGRSSLQQSLAYNR